MTHHHTELIALREAILSDKVPSTQLRPAFGGYWWAEDGLRWSDPESDDPTPVRVCGPIDVLAMARSTEGEDWGLVLAWTDHDGRPHYWVMPLAMLGGDGVEVRKALLAGGLRVGSTRTAREKLTEYFAGVSVDSRAIAAKRCGWMGDIYLLPPTWTVGGNGTERVVYMAPRPGPSPFGVNGSLDAWKESIGVLARGNSRLCFALSVATVPPLLRPLGMESIGVHFVGSSSSGKTTVGEVAASMWGGGPDGYLISWRATSNGLEGVAHSRSDALLVLDELGQVDAKQADDTVYMLGNGVGKQRAGDSGHARITQNWLVCFLSTGELGLEAKLREVGMRPKAGQEVRMIEIPADTGCFGAWEQLHGRADGAAFADDLKSSVRANFGTPIRKFLEEVVPVVGELAPGIRRIQADFAKAMVPPGADGQVKRVAGKFGLAAAAGELGRHVGVFPWEEGEAIQAAAACFRSWLALRGTSGSLESHEGVQTVLAFLDAHGPSRFEVMGEEAPIGPVRNRAGYRRRAPCREWEYLVFPKTMETEVLPGRNIRAILPELHRLGILDKPHHGWAKQVSLSQTHKPKFYVLRPWMVRGGGAG